jgi:hypothetical protein
MVGAGGCCRVGQYEILNRARDREARPAGRGPAGAHQRRRLRGARPQFRIGHAQIDVRLRRHGRHPVGHQGPRRDRAAAMAAFGREAKAIEGASTAATGRPSSGSSALGGGSVGHSPQDPMSEAKYVAVVGEIFVRRDHFALMASPTSWRTTASPCWTRRSPSGCATPTSCGDRHVRGEAHPDGQIEMAITTWCRPPSRSASSGSWRSRPLRA